MNEVFDIINCNEFKLTVYSSAYLLNILKYYLYTWLLLICMNHCADVNISCGNEYYHDFVTPD